MIYSIGQFFGILASVCCIVIPLLQKKRHMLLATAAVNTFFALNLLMIGESGSGLLINCLAVIQAVIALWSFEKDRPITTTENVLFLFLYVLTGALGFGSAIDLLPMVGAVLNMLTIFQRDVRKSRYLLLCNASAFLIYYWLLHASSAIAELCAVIANLAAIHKHRKDSE